MEKHRTRIEKHSIKKLWTNNYKALKSIVKALKNIDKSLKSIEKGTEKH